jgi:glycerate kinase
MAAALGIRFLRADGEPADLAPEHMGAIESVTGETPEFETVRIISDVTNPLLGPEGAPRAFGQQKGASPRQIEDMERALAQLADTVEAGNQSFRDRPGAGAAGGVGFALMAWLDGVMESGATYVADVTGLPARISSADLVITGEGHIDRQSMHGKVPSHVLSLARAASVPVLAVAGRIDSDVATEFATSVELGDAGLIDPIGSMTAAGETSAGLASSI